VGEDGERGGRPTRGSGAQNSGTARSRPKGSGPLRRRRTELIFPLALVRFGGRRCSLFLPAKRHSIRLSPGSHGLGQAC
jgi:hypothetical protein